MKYLGLGILFFLVACSRIQKHSVVTCFSGENTIYQGESIGLIHVDGNTFKFHSTSGNIVTVSGECVIIEKVGE